MKPTRRTLLKWMAATPLTLAGCRSDPNNGRQKPVVIRSSHWGSARDASMWEDLARNFNARQSRIRVKLEHIVGQNYHTKMIAMRIGNCAPDVVAADDEQFRQLADAGVYEDLNPWLARTPEIRPEDYYTQFWESWNVDGTQYALPILGMCLLLYYNKDHRRAAGLSPDPKPDWTWDAFLHDAVVLTRDLDGDGRLDQFAIPRLTWFYCLQWIWSAGGNDMDPQRTHYTFDTPEAKRGFQFHYDHLHKYKVCPQMSDLPNMSTEAVFLTGKVSMIYNGAWWLSEARRAKNFEWDIAHMPLGPVRRSTRATCEAIAITPTTPYKEEAWEWIKFILSEEGQRIVVRHGRGVPAKRSVARALFADPKTPQHEERFLEALDTYARNSMLHKNFMATETVFNREWDRVYLGKITIDEFVARTLPEVNRIIRGEEL
jgi:multiple sugar transport system substrate-binding protein